MIIELTKDMHDEQWKEMFKWLKDNSKYNDEWSVDVWNTLNNLRTTIERAKRKECKHEKISYC